MITYKTISFRQPLSILAASVLFSSMTLAMATPVFAIDATPPATTRGAAKVAAAQEDRMARLKTRAENEIDRRVAGLTKLIDRINGIKRLSADQKTTLVGQVQAEISALNSLKAKIASDTDIATLRTDVQSIVKSYRIYALFIPKTMIIVHADRLLEIIDQLTQYSAKLQDRINTAKANGQDTSAMQQLMDARGAKLADAKTQAQNAINAVTPLTPDGYPGNKTTLQSARTMLQTARADIREAHKDAQQVRQMLVKIKVTTTGTPSATPTP